MTNLHTQLLIRYKLQEKYEKTHNFYMCGPINQIIYDQFETPCVISYKDIFLLSQQFQFMRRQYRIMNNENQPEIKEKISLLANYYSSNHFIAYNYPLMIVVDTKKFFFRRLRRMKKNLAYDNSSDYDCTPSSELHYDFSTVRFLDNDYQDSLSCVSLRSQRRNISYESSQYNIFEESPPKTEEKLEIKEVQSLRNSEQGFESYMIQFNDFDAKKTVDNFLQLKKKIEKQGKYSLHLLDEDISPNFFFESTLGNFEIGKVDRAAELRRIQRRKFLYDRRKTIDNRITKDKQYQQSSKRKKQNLPPVLTQEEQKQTRRVTKQRIRDKAAELLNRVRNQKYSDHDE